MHSDTVPPTAYDIGGQRWVKDAPGFAEAIAQAFEQRFRPRCLCRRNPDGQGIEMYVARLMDGYIVKRMPNTGNHHSTNCPSYEQPAEFSGLGALIGTAIVENTGTGKTTLKLDFPLTKLPGRSSPRAVASANSSMTSQGLKLSLRALLHYLWEQAELSHWKPSFSGRRSWGTVRKLLLQAAQDKFIHGQALISSFYVPEVFSVEQSNAIHERRRQRWSYALHKPNQIQPLMLIVAEVKVIDRARIGHKAILKHLPEQAFTLDEPMFRRLARNFERELSLWCTEPDTHLIMIATFWMDEAGTPVVIELSLMVTTAHWLPVENAWDLQLTNALVRNGRSFIKGLRYNAAPDQELVVASLLDCGDAPRPLYIAYEQSLGEPHKPGFTALNDRGHGPTWRWHPTDGDMPALPMKQARQPTFPRTVHYGRHVTPMNLGTQASK